MDTSNDLERETNYINNLGREILLECTSAGIYVTTELVIHLVKLKLLNPRNGFFVSRIMSRELTQKFVRSCVADLTYVSPVLDCIRMQAYWAAVSSKLDEVKEVYYAHVAEKSESALKDIYNMENEEKNLKKIAVFVVVYGNIGNSNLQQNVKETINPLKSVLKEQDIRFFFTLTEYGKLEFLKYVTQLVSGIRIYQFYYKKGSESVDNSPLLLINSANSAINDLKVWMDKLSNRIDLLVKELYYLYGAMPGMVETEIPEGFGAEDIVELQRIHHIMEQHLTYVKALVSSLEAFVLEAQDLTYKFIASVEALHETIGLREAIPTSDVYEQFTEVSDNWSTLQSEGCYLICIGLIVKNMFMINKYLPLTRLEVALGLTDRDPKIADEREKNRRIYLQGEGDDVTLVNMSEDIVLQFNGFCAWTLVTTDGALLPARTKLGVLRYNDRHYGFFSSEAADNWRANPELNIRRAYEVVRRNPEMVHLLDMYEFLYGLRSEILVKDREERNEFMQTRSVQTVPHPVHRRRDKDYSFSVWELRCKALQLSRIVKCETKSVQTVNHSHFRASVGVQCSKSGTKGTDAMRDESCVHEAVANYIWGLRGRSDGRCHVLGLTRPVEESYRAAVPGGERPCHGRCRSPREEAEESSAVSAAAVRDRLIDSYRWMEGEYMNIIKSKQKLYSHDVW